MEGVWFDNGVMQAIADHRTAWATAVADGVMAAGTTPIVLAACAVVALVVVGVLQSYRAAVAAVAALIVATVAADGLKVVFGRPRPPAHLALVGVSGDSFPSTHAAATSAVAVAVLVAFPWGSRRTARAAALALAALLVLVGVCMVYVGAHWPTDVLAGWLLGGLVGGAFGLLARSWRRGATSRSSAPGRAERPVLRGR